ELLDTRHFTTTEAITRAVALNLGVFNHYADDIDAKIGRAMLEALGIPETGMADHDILIDAVHCHEHLRGLALQENAWDRVHAFERGLAGWDRQGNLKTVPLRAAA